MKITVCNVDFENIDGTTWAASAGPLTVEVSPAGDDWRWEVIAHGPTGPQRLCNCKSDSADPHGSLRGIERTRYDAMTNAVWSLRTELRAALAEIEGQA